MENGKMKKTTIKLEIQTKDKLTDLKDGKETYDDVVNKLIDQKVIGAVDKRGIIRNVVKGSGMGSITLPIKWHGKKVITTTLHEDKENVSLVKTVKAKGNASGIYIPESWVGEKTLTYLLE